MKHFSILSVIICRNRINNLTKIRSCVGSKYFSTSTKLSSSIKPLKLMETETIVWPNVFKTVKNWIMTALIIKPYLDSSFRLSDFMIGAKQATQIVSELISQGKFDQLESNNLVTKDCLVEIQKNIADLNLAQRQEISILPEDIYFSFPYEIGMIFEDQPKPGRISARSVEITVVFHVLKGHAEMIKRGDTIPLNIGVLPEFRDKIFILNYRFIRDYTKGVNDTWTLNLIHHNKPSEDFDNSK